MASQIPANLESITPEWLNQILIASGTINDSAITSVESERLGLVLRLRPTYDTFEESAPVWRQLFFLLATIRIPGRSCVIGHGFEARF